MYLEADTFRTVVANTPLVSIDLLVSNHEGKILLGQRLNRPAQGSWFVPGGRIYKNERLAQAFQRISKDELGLCFTRDDSRLLGVYEHFYDDSVFGDEEDAPSTHYVVLGHHIALDADTALMPPQTQHRRYRWWQPEEMQACDQVHSNSKTYLNAYQPI